MQGSSNRTLIYSLMQALFWMFFCAVIGFGVVFLLQEGFSATSIGLIVALANIAGAILQPLIADFADRSERVTLSHLIILLAAIAMAASFLSVTLSGAAVPYIYGLLIAVTSIMMPLINAVGMYFNAVGYHCNYGIARAMGSLGFALISFFMGYYVEWFGAGSIPMVAFVLAGILLLVMVAVPTPIHIPLMDDKDETFNQKILATGFVKRYPGFFLILIGVVLVFSFHNMTNTYLIQMIQHVGGAEKDLGFTLALAAVLELPAMILFTRFQKRINTVNIMRLATIFFVLKGLAYVFAGNVFHIYGTQLLHALSFAPFMPALVYYSSERMKRQDQVKGQAMVTTAITLGGVFGNTVGGILTDQTGVFNMLLAGLVLVVVGAIAVFYGIKEQNASKEGLQKF